MVERSFAAPSLRAPSRLRLGLLVTMLLLVLDWSRPAPRQLSTRVLLGAIDLYQATLSPLMPVAGVRCRFRPTCSRYGEAVIRRDGFLLGTVEAAWRIARCGPWTAPGTHDPP